MSSSSTRVYRLLRVLGRLVTRSASIATFGNMPPFVSASALVRRGDHLLVVIDPIREEPILPGGHVRWREKPEDAVVREVREETGIEIRPERVVAVLSGEEWAGEGGIVRIVYTASAIGGSLASSGEGEATWVPLVVAADTMRRDAPILRGWLEGWSADVVPVGP